MADIRSKAIANGTYMKAPNGEKSNLNEAQWLHVRTKSFKEWFGDWENYFKKQFLLNGDSVSNLIGNEFSRIEGKTLTDQVSEYFDSIGNKAISPLYGEVILDRNGVDDSLGHGMGRKKAIAYAAVKDVIEKGILLDYDKNHKDRGYDSAVIAAPIKIGGDTYVCSVIITRKEDNRFYLHEVIEQKKLSENASKPVQQEHLPKAFAKIYKNIISASDNVSKIIDENGEPKVVYHFTPNEFTVFDLNNFGLTDTGDHGRGFYFTSKNSEKDIEFFKAQYGENAMQVFLNIRNPKQANKNDGATFYFNRERKPYKSHKESLQEELKRLSNRKKQIEYMLFGDDEDYARYKDPEYIGTKVEKNRLANIEKKIISLQNEIDNLKEDYDENAEFNSKVDALNSYDGVINGDFEIVVPSSNQVKSATINLGTYSKEENDIRYAIESNEQTASTPQTSQQKDITTQALEHTIDVMGVHGHEVYNIAGMKEEEVLNPNNPLHIIGEKGAEALDALEQVTTRLDNLNLAKSMESFFEMDAKSIKLTTGWEKGKDGKWRYEISDIKIKEDFIEKTYYKIKSFAEKKGKKFYELSLEERKELPDFQLSDILENEFLEALLKTYPKLKNATLRIYDDSPESNSTTLGYYSNSNNTLMLNFLRMPSSKGLIKEIQETLVHEIQHIIQREEGFTQGGDITIFESDSSVVKIDNEIKEAKQHLQEKEKEYFNDNKEYKKIQKLEAELQNINNLIEINNNLPPIIENPRFKEVTNLVRDLADRSTEATLEGNEELADKLNKEYEEAFNELKKLPYRIPNPNKQDKEKLKKEKEQILETLTNLKDKFYKNNSTDEIKKLRDIVDRLEFKRELALYVLYEKIAGETEARNVSIRMKKSLEERRKTLLSETADIAEEDQIIIEDYLKKIQQVQDISKNTFPQQGATSSKGNTSQEGILSQSGAVYSLANSQLSDSGSKDIKNNTTKAKNTIKKIKNRDLSINTSGSINSVLMDIANKLGFKYRGSSNYLTCNTPLEVATIRLSDHEANAGNFKTRINFSIVIQNRKFDKLDSYVQVEEFVCQPEVFDNNREFVVAEIIRGIESIIDEGHFITNSKFFTKVDTTPNYFKTSKGEVYGFLDTNNNIGLDFSIISAEHPIHEYTHFWDKIVQVRNPELWNKGVELMKNIPLWNRIANDSNYGKAWEAQGKTGKELEDLIASVFM